MYLPVQPITTFDEVREYLAMYVTNADPTPQEEPLGRMRNLMNYLGNPQNATRVIHVAGTSGKTSTSYYVAALLKAKGYNVGLTVSPHVNEINDRVQVNLLPVPEKLFCNELATFLSEVRRSSLLPTYFEFMLAFAFWYFARQKVDYAVVEVGIGGLYDSSNVINRNDKVCIITDIGLDHIQILGKTISEISFQKAGIIHPKNDVFCYEQSDTVMQPIRQQVKMVDAQLHIVPSQAIGLAPKGLPLFQRRNLMLARASVSFLLPPDKHVRDTDLQVASQIIIPGRMEILKLQNKFIIIDGAHNPQKIKSIFKSVQEKFPNKSIVSLVGFGAGNDYRLEESMKIITTYSKKVVFTSFDGPEDFPRHSVPTKALMRVAEGLGYDSYESCAITKDGLLSLLGQPEDIIIITGSFYLLNHVRPLLLKSKKGTS